MKFKNFSVDDIIALDDVGLTQAASDTLEKEDIYFGLFLHSNHEWGIAPAKIFKQNEQAIKNGGEVISVYRSVKDILFVVGTELGEVNKTVVALLEEVEI